MELAARVERILEEQVRPQLALHQGGIELVDCNASSGVLRVRLTGQCAGCPSAALTTQQLVAEQICNAVEEIREVVLVNGVSDELLQEARELLARRHQ